MEDTKLLSKLGVDMLDIKEKNCMSTAMLKTEAKPKTNLPGNKGAKRHAFLISIFSFKTY